MHGGKWSAEVPACHSWLFLTQKDSSPSFKDSFKSEVLKSETLQVRKICFAPKTKKTALCFWQLLLDEEVQHTEGELAV